MNPSPRQPADSGIPLTAARLAQFAADDKTKPSSTNVKVAHPDMVDGENVETWTYSLITCAVAKECIEALQKPMPFTRADAAATILLSDSTPKEFIASITRAPSAYDAFNWIVRKFQGGYDRSINKEWLRRLTEEGMTREENFEQYILRKSNLFNNLLANGHSLHPDDLANAIIDGLPAEFSAGRTSLYAPCSGASTDGILRILRAHAHGLRFNDLRPRPEPKAAAVNLPGKSEDRQNNNKTGRRPRC
jgi:hypothetical protein